MMKTKWIAILGMASLPLQTAFGAFVLVDNFDALNTASLGTQNGWTSSVSGANNSLNVIANPLSGGTGKLLEMKKSTTAGSIYSYKNFASPIANISTASTVFFRMYSASTVMNIVAGATETPSAAFGDYATIARLNSTTGLDVYNGNTLGNPAASNGGYLTADVTPLSAKWYDIWLVINNSADTYQMYYSEDGGAQTLATAGSPSLNTFTMRNGGVQAINAFMVATSQMTGGATTSYIDDIYIDTTGSNLISPVPEPSAALIGGLGMLTLLRRRRV